MQSQISSLISKKKKKSCGPRNLYPYSHWWVVDNSTSITFTSSPVITSAKRAASYHASLVQMFEARHIVGLAWGCSGLICFCAFVVCCFFTGSQLRPTSFCLLSFVVFPRERKSKYFIQYLSSERKWRLLALKFDGIVSAYNSENGQMCAMKEVRVISDHQNSNECLKQLNQVSLSFSPPTTKNLYLHFFLHGIASEISKMRSNMLTRSVLVWAGDSIA
jgi:hypothetical protein